MQKKILTVILLVVAGYMIYKYGVDVFNHYYYEHIKQTAKPLAIPPVAGLPPPPPMQMEAGPLKVVMDSETPWESIAKLVSTILGTYLGIKIINKYVK